MRFLNRFLVLICGIFCAIIGAHAQVEMADAFRADGKIYVVVAVVGVILGGIVFYLLKTEAKIQAIEKRLSQKS